MRPEKKILVDEVSAHLAKSKYLLLVDFAQVTVPDAAEIRGKLTEFGAEYHVVKNSILSVATKQAGLPDLSAHLNGHTALITGGNNIAGVAKVIVKFFEDKSRLAVKVGILDSRVLTKEEVTTISSLPSLDGIRAQILSLLSAPATQLVRLLVAKVEKEEGTAKAA